MICAAFFPNIMLSLIRRKNNNNGVETIFRALKWARGRRVARILQREGCSRGLGAQPKFRNCMKFRKVHQVSH